MGHVQQRRVSAIPEKALIEVPPDGPTRWQPAIKGARKSAVRFRAGRLPLTATITRMVGVRMPSWNIGRRQPHRNVFETTVLLAWRDMPILAGPG